MQFDEVVLGRRSIRGFKKDPLPVELIKEIVALATRAPSSMHTQPWYFHAVAGDKRGAHLTLSLERLDALIASSGRPKPVRIGLSATIRPLEEVARFLGGQTWEEGRLGLGKLVDWSSDPRSTSLPRDQSTGLPVYQSTNLPTAKSANSVF